MDIPQCFLHLFQRTTISVAPSLLPWTCELRSRPKLGSTLNTLSTGGLFHGLFHGIMLDEPICHFRVSGQFVASSVFDGKSCYQTM